tara:strand:- start:745 stop:1038 length:294 start_codon:yes stop_codon:yes gene_type:complete
VNKTKQETFKRSDIETSLKKQFPNLSKLEILKAIDAILDSIIEAVALDEKVEIRGFGTFSKKYIRPRKFINPKTKKISYLGETATLHFKPSKSIMKL